MVAGYVRVCAYIGTHMGAYMRWFCFFCIPDSFSYDCYIRWFNVIDTLHINGLIQGNINVVYEIYVHRIALNMGWNAWKSATKLKRRQRMEEYKRCSFCFRWKAGTWLVSMDVPLCIFHFRFMIYLEFCLNTGPLVLPILAANLNSNYVWKLILGENEGSVKQ